MGVASVAVMDSGTFSVPSRAALNAPRRRRQARGWLAPETFVFDNLPPHQKDNQYIRRYYRANYSWKRSLLSLFSLHNETGNIWTHLIGVVIFVCLICATVRVAPEPLALGSSALSKLEQRLYEYGKTNLYELLETVESWEAKVLKVGSSGLGSIEERLGSFGLHNLHDLVEFQETLRRYGKRGVKELSGFGRLIRRFSRSGMEELASMEQRLVGLGPRALADADEAVQRALAAVLDTQWPARRWPVYVFMAGAVVCLATSSLCHLFGCCAAHVSTRIWRLDYAGIAVLTVTSFYPPVYYGFMCAPATRAAYLAASTGLGLAALAVTLLPFFQRPSYHRVRAATFAALGLWGVVPLLHASLLNAGVKEVQAAITLDVVMGVIYLAGAALYAARVPERWWPGAFDMVGHSHQIFHIAVVVAACVHYRATRILMHWRETTGGCGPGGLSPVS